MNAYGRHGAGALKWTRQAAFLFGIGIAAATAPPIAGCQGPCGGASDSVRCSSLVSVTAHVPSTAAALAGGQATLCRNGTCAHGVIQAPVDAGGPAASFELTASPFTASGQLDDEGDGFTTVRLEPGGPFGKADQYEVTIAAPDGTALLDVTRPMPLQTGTAGCPPTTCYVGAIDVYPSSASGLTCTASSCPSPGIRFIGAFATNDTVDPILVSGCRNDVCGSANLALPGGGPDGGGRGYTEIVEGFPATVQIEAHMTGYEVLINRTDDPAALANGDVYRVAVTQNGNALASWSGPVTYVESSPNGPSCDAVPCRSAQITLM
jgi:hypothetical protein